MHIPRIAISGVSRGIGEGLARAFLDQGWHVHGLGRAAGDWTAEIGRAWSFSHCDFSVPSTVGAACAAVSDPLDVIFCNAASFGRNAFSMDHFDPSALTETFTTNVVSQLVMVRALRPKLHATGKRLIILMSTGNASLTGNVQGQMLGYRASKSALNQSMRNLAAEWAKDGITSIALNPGWVRTDMGGPEAPLSVSDASQSIFRFVDEIAGPSFNGMFVNTDGSSLPW